MFSEVEIRTVGRPFYPLHSQILEEIYGAKHCDLGGGNLAPECGDMGLPLVPECPLKTSVLTLHMCDGMEKCYFIDAAITKTMSSPPIGAIGRVWTPQ